MFIDRICEDFSHDYKVLWKCGESVHQILVCVFKVISLVRFSLLLDSLLKASVITPE